LYSELFTNNNFEYNFVLFVLKQSLEKKIKYSSIGVRIYEKYPFSGAEKTCDFRMARIHLNHKTR
jgi:hypothetical protein